MHAAHILIGAMFALPLAAGAAWDLTCFRIPNLVSLGLAALFPLAVLLSPVPVPWGWHLAAGAIVLTAGMGLFALKLLGGGDVKLMAAAALWLGMNSLGLYLLLVSVAGAALTLVLLALRPALAGLGERMPVLRPRAGIPYGIAIAAGGLMLVEHLPMLGG